MPAACPLRRPSDYEGPSSHQWLSEDEGHQGPKTVRWRSDHEKLSDFRGAVVMSARPRAQAPPLSPSVARAEVSNDPEDAENLPYSCGTPGFSGAQANLTLSSFQSRSSCFTSSVMCS